MIILTQTQAADLGPAAERMRLAVAAAPIALQSGSVSFVVTVSAGAAVFRRDLDDAESLVKRADRALYRAKEAGRNRVEVDDGTKLDAPESRAAG